MRHRRAQMKLSQALEQLAELRRQFNLAVRAIVQELRILNRAGVSTPLMRGLSRRDRSELVKAALAERYRERGSCC
jgi:F0F1-type ATP synthase membrane subunit b/b'